MKRFIKQLSVLVSAFLISYTVTAQSPELSDSVMVNGNCGMCKKKIEKSAMDAGATFSFWDKKTKMLTVKYNSSKTNMNVIETKVASGGYDTENVKASDESYFKLEECCQYKRDNLKIQKQ